MKAVLAALSLLLFAGSAWAGCSLYPEDGPPPKAKTCYKDTCEDTTIVAQCANVFDFTIRFSNGFESSGRLDESTGALTHVTTLNGKLVNNTDFCWEGERTGSCRTAVG